jgi:membrane associated rhomboid family serine protease
MTTTDTPTCTKHPTRQTWLSCSRCGRPWCHECLIQGSVGAHCPDCLKAAAGPAGERLQRKVQYASRDGVLVTKVLIGIMVAVQLIAMARSAGGLGRGNALADDFALRGAEVRDGELWRLLTAAFLHYGLFHILMNCLLLWQLGLTLERPLGKARYLGLFLACCLAGSFGALLLSPNGLTAGASGGVFGLMGAAVALQKKQGTRIGSTMWGPTLLINLAITFAIPGISIGGHLGGLAAGWLGATLLYGRRFRRSDRGDYLSDVAALVMIGIIAVVGSMFVARGITGPTIKEVREQRDTSVDVGPSDAELDQIAVTVVDTLERVADERALTSEEVDTLRSILAQGLLSGPDRDRAVALLKRPR